MNTSVAKPSGLRMGPPKPVLVFWSGDHYLGEVIGHPSQVEEARAKLACHIDMLYPALERAGLRNRLFRTNQIRLSLGGEYVPWPGRNSIAH